MKSMKQWFKRAPEGAVTVCWMEDGVSFIRWAPQAGRVRVCRQFYQLGSAAVSGRTYREGLAAVAGADSTAPPAVHWLIVKESFPLRMEGEGDGEKTPNLPEWILRCWEGLEMREVPGEIVCGVGALQKELQEWHEFKESGRGLCLQLGQRVLFIGQGNGKAFHRLSRHGLAAPTGGSFVSREWLLQTRLLFRNATGAALRRVYIPEGSECAFSWENEEPFEIIPGVRPPAWCGRLEGLPDPGLLFLHLSLFRSLGDPACRIQLSQLEQRRRSWKLERHLRVGTCLLLGGWSFLLLGACRHDGPLSADAGRELQALRTEVAALDQRWHGLKQHETMRKEPYRLVGMLADSAPEEVEVERIRMEPSGAKNPGGYLVRIDGAFASGKPTPGFRQWVEYLREDTLFEKVENLSFGRSKERLEFSLQGTTLGKGGH